MTLTSDKNKLIFQAANTIPATLYLLAKNQGKQDKLRELLKKDSDESIRYVKACVKEGLRMMPVVAGNARITSKDYNILGYTIPKDVSTFTKNVTVQRFKIFILIN